MAIITLISDWGDTDYYAAAVKGAILSRMPEAVIVDISHKVPRFNIAYAAYLLKNAYKSFPKGTVHLIGVDSEEKRDQYHVVVSYDGHFFIGLDNGIFTLMFHDAPHEIVSLEWNFDNDFATTFPCRDRFAKAAVHLAQQKPLQEIGKPIETLQSNLSFQPTGGKSDIHGIVIFLDTYENLITNIPQEFFNKVIGKRKFVIKVKSYRIDKIHDGYDTVPEGEIVCLFGSNGLLQIAINRGKASTLLNIQVRDKVVISAKEDDNSQPK